MISSKAHLKTTIILADKKESNSLDGDNFVFGRSIKSNVFINDPSLSRFHFKIFINQQTLSLTDLGSSNGTSINNIRMKQNSTVQIYSGDIISIENTDTKIIIENFDIYQGPPKELPQKNKLAKVNIASTTNNGPAKSPSIVPENKDFEGQNDLVMIMNKIIEDAQSKAVQIINRAQEFSDEQKIKTIAECNTLVEESQQQVDTLRESAFNEAINNFTQNEKNKISEEFKKEKEKLNKAQLLESQKINEQHEEEKAALLKSLESYEEKIEQLKYEFKKIDKEVSLKREHLTSEMNLEYTTKQQELRKSYEESEAANELRKKETDAIHEKEFNNLKEENKKEKNEFIKKTKEVENNYLIKKEELNKIEREIETIIEKRLQDIDEELLEHKRNINKTMEELETNAILRKKEINSQLAEETKRTKEELQKIKEEKKAEAVKFLKEFQKDQDENKNEILISFRDFKKEEEEKKNEFINSLEEFKENIAIKRKDFILSDSENEKKRQKLLIEKDLEYKKKQQAIIKSFEEFEATIELTKVERLKNDQEILTKSKQRLQTQETELIKKQTILQKSYDELESSYDFKKNEFDKMDQVHQEKHDSKIQTMNLETDNKKNELLKTIKDNEHNHALNTKLQLEIQFFKDEGIRVKEENNKQLQAIDDTTFSITSQMNILKEKLNEQKVENSNLEKQKELNLKFISDIQNQIKNEEIKLKKTIEDQLISTTYLEKITQEKDLIFPQFQALNNQLSDLNKKIEIATLQNNKTKSDFDKSILDLENKHIETKSNYTNEMRLLTIKEENRLQELLRDEMLRIGKIKEESLRLVLDLEDSITKEISNASSKIFAETIGVDRYREIAPLFEKTLRTTLQSGVLKLLHNQLEPSKDGKKKTLSSTKKNWKPFSTGIASSAIVFLLLPYIYKEIQIENDPVQQNLRAEARAREFAPPPIAKFIPQKVKELGSNFTNSVIYTENFCETYAIEKFRSDLIKEGMDYLYKNWKIPEEKSIESYSLMFSLIDTLKEKRENINPEFEKKDIAKMETLENETMKKVEALLGNGVRLEAALKFQNRFYQTFIEIDSKKSAAK